MDRGLEIKVGEGRLGKGGYHREENKCSTSCGLRMNTSSLFSVLVLRHGKGGKHFPRGWTKIGRFRSAFCVRVRGETMPKRRGEEPTLLSYVGSTQAGKQRANSHPTLTVVSQYHSSCHKTIRYFQQTKKQPPDEEPTTRLYNGEHLSYDRY